MWYRTGTINVTAGSNTVTGTGTAWLNLVLAGEGLDAPDGRVYEIAEVVNNTQITLTSNYLGATAAGAAYQVIPNASLTKVLTQRVNLLLSSYETELPKAFQRANHTGTQTLATISDAGTAASRNVTTSPIANQTGTVLQSGDFGIGTAYPGEAAGVPLDLNAWPAVNMRGMSSGFTNSPASGVWFMVEQHAHNNLYAVQTARSFTTVGPISYVRNKSNGAWSAWFLEGNTNTAIGSVALSASSAIMEGGSNANGFYAKFLNGLLVCSITHTFAGNSPAGGEVREFAWTFPALYATNTPPVVTGAPIIYADAATFIGNNGGTAVSNSSAPRLALKIPGPGIGDFPVLLSAIGYWK